MTQLAAGLIGVILGAVVSEVLRLWHDKRQQAAALKGRLRLIRYEMALTMAYLEQDGLSADDLRGAVDRGVIKDDQWQAGQALLSESLSHDQWLSLAHPYLAVQLLKGHPDEDDEILLQVGQRILTEMKEAGDTVWSHDGL